MSLVNCPDCGKEISDMAKNCPNCGAPNPFFQSDKPLAGEVYIPCSVHADRKSVAQCSECGKHMCNECAVGHIEFNDGTKLCPDCNLKLCKQIRDGYVKSRILSILSLIWYTFFIIIALIDILYTHANASTGDKFKTIWECMMTAALVPAFISYFRSQKNDVGSKNDILSALAFIKNPLIYFFVTFITIILLSPIVGIISIYRHIMNLLMIKKNYPISVKNVKEAEAVVLEHKSNN